MIQHAPVSVAEILDRVVDKGIVIDAWLRLAVVGIDLITVDAHVVVASLETYLKYSAAQRDAVPATVVGDTPPRRPRGARSVRALRIVREAFDALNGHDVERYAGLLADGYVGETHGLMPPLRGREAGSHAMDTYFRILPDFHFAIEDAIATGEDVLVSWVATGTPRDEYNGAKLTARPLRIPGCTVTRLRRQKIVHTWHYWDAPSVCG